MTDQANPNSRGSIDVRVIAAGAVGVLILYILFTFGVLRIPPGFYVDESCIAYNGYLIATTGVAENGTSFPLYFQCYTQGYAQYMSAAQPYALALLYLFVPPSVFSARMFAATIVFAAIMLLGYLASRRSGSRTVGIIVAVTGVLTPWFFELGRLVQETFVLIFAITLLVFLLHRASIKERWGIWEIVPIAATLAVITYGYATGRMIAPLFAVGLALFIRNLRRLGAVFVIWILYGLTLIPLVVVYIRNPAAISGRFLMATNLSRGKGILENIWTVMVAYASDIGPWNMIFEGDQHLRHHVPGMGEFLVPTFALGLFGLVLVLVRYRRDPWWQFVLYGAFVAILPGAITYERWHSMRDLAFPIFFTLLTVPAISWLLGKPLRIGGAHTQLPPLERYLRSGLLYALLALTAVQAVGFQYLFWTEGASPQRQSEFDAAYPGLLDRALAEGSRPIYLDEGPEPAYIHAYWYGAIKGLDRSNFVHLLDNQSAPNGSIVLTSDGSCGECEVIERAGAYLLYRSLKASGPIVTPAPAEQGQSLGSGPGQFFRPHGIAVGPDGRRYIADTDNKRIEILGADGKFVYQFGRAGEGEGDLQQPHGIAVDRSGDVFVTDSARHMLIRFKADGTFVKEWHGVNVPFYGPRDIAFGPDGDLYIVDQGCTRIVRFDPENGEYSFWGTAGSGEGEFKQATGIDVAGGMVFVTDTGNGRVQVFDLNGKFLRQWPVPEWKNDEQEYPDVAYDTAAKRVYITSSKTKEVLVFDVNGNRIDSVKPEPPSQLDAPSNLIVLHEGDKSNLLIVNSGGVDPTTSTPGVIVIGLEGPRGGTKPGV